jgi:hypothetical protein
MKPRFSNQRTHALTITEVLVIVVAVCLLALVALAQSEDSQAKNQIIGCVNNLKQIGLAYRVWEGDHGDKFPQHIPTRKGGAMEPVALGNAASIFQVMSNELWTPRVLICPADADRFVANGFVSGFDNSHVSYFAGVDADDDKPAMFLSGDDNFAIDGVPVKSGLLLLATNAPVSWTAARHVNQGNIGRADGSVATSSSNWSPLTQLLAETGVATNRLAIP